MFITYRYMCTQNMIHSSTILAREAQWFFKLILFIGTSLHMCAICYNQYKFSYKINTSFTFFSNQRIEFLHFQSGSSWQDTFSIVLGKTMRIGIEVLESMWSSRKLAYMILVHEYYKSSRVLQKNLQKDATQVFTYALICIVDIT